MATEKWIAGSGAGLTWTTCVGAEFTSPSSFTNGQSVLSSVSITNASYFDIFADVSIKLAALTTVAPSFIGVYLYPLNQDGSTYGDNHLTTTPATAVPSAQYWVGNIIFPVLTTTAAYGMISRIILPPGTFSFAFYNQSGATLATSGNAAAYRTYNRSVA